MAQPLSQDINVAKLFLGGVRYRTASYTNDTGSDITLAKGTILGRVNDDNKVYPTDNGNSDGSQLPRFILAEDYEVADGATSTMTFAVCGRVNKDLLVFNRAGNALTDIVKVYGVDSQSPAEPVTVDLGTVFDVLEDRGFYLETVNDLTEYDN